MTYSLSGASSDGEFYMSGKYKCSIDLNGVSLTNKTPVYSGAALHIQNGKRVNASVKKGTENTLIDCASPSDDLAQKAALYVKGHAEFKGKGTLNVKSQYKHAIKAGEYITVKNCTINVTGAVSDGFNCNQYFLMESGSISINNIDDDGIQCEIDEDSDATSETTDHEDENSGSIYITDGTITANVTATAAKGLKASGNFIASGGTVTISTSGGGEWDSDQSKTKASSCISADGDISISGGTFGLTAEGAGGKGISGDGTFLITDGDISINTSGGIVYYSGSKISTTTSSQTAERLSSNYKSSPKGIKIDGTMTISGGTLNVKAAYHEAIETKGALNITGGTIYTQSSDDAINSGGVMTISGGTVCAYSTGNDGLDANADFTIKGGIVYAIGASSPEVGIDAKEHCTLTISGGTLVAIGGLESGAVTTQTCYQLSSSSSSSNGNNGRGGFGGFGPGQQSSGKQTWTANTWYGLYANGILALAFACLLVEVFEVILLVVGDLHGVPEAEVLAVETLHIRPLGFGCFFEELSEAVGEDPRGAFLVLEEIQMERIIAVAERQTACLMIGGDEDEGLVGVREIEIIGDLHGVVHIPGLADGGCCIVGMAGIVDHTTLDHHEEALVSGIEEGYGG